MGENPTMPTTRPAAALVILVAAAATARSQAPAPEAPPAGAPATAPGAQASAPAPAPSAADSPQLANNVLFNSIVKLRLRPRIAAKVEQVVDMLNQKFVLKGNYYKDTGNRVRLQLDYQGAANGGSTMLQVCDGKTRWEYQRVMGMTKYAKLDVAAVLKKLEEPGLDEDFRSLVLTQLGFGGPEALLSGFVAAVGFDQFADQEVDGVPSYVLGGKWKDRSKLVDANNRQLSPTAPLPPYIPANIQVFIEKESLWPYRIEMRGAAPSMLAEDTRAIDPITKRPIGRALPQPKVDPTQITLRYTLLPESEIKPDEQFVFAPPRDATPVDETDTFMSYLDQGIQAKLNEKKVKEAAAEAAGEPAIRMPAMELGAPPPPISTGPAGSVPAPK